MNLLQTMSTAALLMGSLATTADAQTADAPIIGRTRTTLQSDRMTPEVLWSMGRIGAAHVSPDGKTLLYTVSYYSVAQNKSHTVIYTAAADGTNERLLTTTAQSESEPTFIQGGTRIAFLSSQNGKSQLWSMNLDGTDRKVLSTSDSDVEGYLFSPDEKQVILVHMVPTYASIAKPYDDLPKASGMVINDLNYKHWDHYVKEIPHPFVATLAADGTYDREEDLLAGTSFECPSLPFGGTEQLAWSPDSKSIAYTCKKMTGLQYAVSTDSDIYLWSRLSDGTTTTRNLCKPEGYQRPQTVNDESFAHQSVNQNATDCNMGYDINPQFSPDGSRIAWLSMERDGYESDRQRLCILDFKTGQKTYVTESFESGVDDYCWADSKTLYFIGVWHGTTQIYRTDLKGKVQQLTTGQHDYASLQMMGKNLLAKRHSMKASDDLYLINTKNGEATQLTFENKPITDQLADFDVKERWIKTTDGQDMLAWVIYPPHFDPQKKYPTLLFCEGGPQSPVSQFWSYRWNFQIMAAQGYIIIAPNRRGLPGFGMKWLEQISGDYTGQCMQDYLSAIDDISKEPYVDTDHLGCVGASFGGFSVYWLAGHHQHRFKAFIAHDGMYNTHQQYLETEEMWFTNWDLGGAPWKKGILSQADGGSRTPQLLEKAGGHNPYLNSPHLFVDRWDTPILCIHGEKDYRILASQGQTAFDAAIMRGVPAQLLLYPDENHWVLKPQNGILWQRTFFAWLQKWLK